jgi:hypothetical protein
VDEPTITYTARSDVTPELELNALASIYKLCLSSCANRNAAGGTSTNGDDAKERSRHDSSARNIIQEPN